jgi:hypothetical protein
MLLVEISEMKKRLSSPSLAYPRQTDEEVFKT